MLQSLRWGFMGIVLTVVALIMIACGSGDAPAATPAVSPDRPTFIFFFTDG